ncbi:MAG TPA: hypothetical protein VIG46_10765 [Candidatus Baltobacteraceae bacterium]|jgi:hypothetical protein
MAFENSALGDVLEWFLTRIGDRRQYKRRPGAFHLWWQADPKDASKSVAGRGIELSPNGLVFIIPTAIAAPEYTLIAAIRDHKIPIRVKTVRGDTVEHQGKRWHRYMVSFQGVSADDWDLIVRYVNDTPEPADRRKMQNQEMAEQTDDAYRLLPMAIQNKIIQTLVRSGKLEAPKPGQTPLLKLFYGGLVKQAGKPPAHRFNVHSRVVKDGEVFAYDSRFLVDDEGNVAAM